MKKKSLFINCILFYFAVSINYAQNTKTLLDSTFNFLGEKYYEHKFTDSIKAKFYAETYLKKALQEKDTNEIIDGFAFKSEIQKNDSILLNYLDNLIDKTQIKPSKNYPANAFKNKGRHYYFRNDNQKSLINFLQALRYADLKSNDSLSYIIKLRISRLKYRNREYTESLKIKKEVYKYYKNKKQLISDIEFLNLILNLSTIHLKNKKIDSAIFFNDKAHKYFLRTKDSILLTYIFMGKGRIEFHQKKYDSAIINFKKTIFSLNEEEDYLNLLKTYSDIAKSYKNLDSTENALEYNLKVDSLSTKHNLTHETQRTSYSFLINYYKENKNLEKQLFYINKLIKVDSILDTREKQFAKTFVKEYDIPKLKEEKQQIIDKLEKENKKFNTIKFSLLILALLFITLTGYQYKKRITLEKRFTKLQKSLSKEKAKKRVITKLETADKPQIPEEIIGDILKELQNFEKNNRFTNQKITLNSLAKQLNTNSNYLSKTINLHKGIGFSEYLNQLRIEHTLTFLQKDATLRKYTIKAIANEVGFNTSESFAKAFHKKTGLKPSYYIKKLNEKEAT